MLLLSFKLPTVVEHEFKQFCIFNLCSLSQLKASVNKDMLRPTGRVVGIIKRNWRPYCGMLSKSQIKEVRKEST